MNSLDEVDSLAQEVKRMGQSKGYVFRPNTTGEMDVKTTMKLAKRSHNPDSFRDERLDGKASTRPHAPMQSRRGSLGSNAVVAAECSNMFDKPSRGARADVGRRGGGSQAKKTRKKKSDSLADQWEELQRFSKVNSSRSLSGQVRIDYIYLLMPLTG